MLAGNLRGSLRAELPVLAFKAAYHGLTALRRIGLGPAMPEAVAAAPRG
jgi:hypothetical protein